MKVTDIAKSINPKLKLEYIGIRPGEKLHEEMIGFDDSYYTYEYKDYYKILPAINNWNLDKRIKKGKLVAEGFSYTSNNNKKWMSIDQLRKWVKKYRKNRNKIMIPYSKQEITNKDIAAVVKVMRSPWLTQGPMVEKFENMISKYSNAKYASAVNSATSALHLACMALNVGPGDWVWTSSNSFVASANCAIYCGAKIDFVDIDEKTFNICVKQLEIKLIKAKKEKNFPKVLIPVHFAGQPCDMEKIFTLSKQYKFKIIEDASHAIGAHYKLKNSKKKKYIKIGSCTQ